MKILFEKTKLIIIFLTFLNIGLGSFGYFQELSPFLILSTVIIVEFIILLMYLLIVTYNWLRIHLNLMNEGRLEGINLLQKQLEQIEISLIGMISDTQKELQTITSLLSSRFDSSEILINKKLSNLSKIMASLQEKTTAKLIILQQEITNQIDKKSSEQTSNQQALKEELKTSISKLILLQQEITNQIDKKSSEQTSNQQALKEELETSISKLILLQQEITNQIDKKSSEQTSNQQTLKEELKKSISKLILLQQETTNQIDKKSSEQIYNQEIIKEELKTETSKLISLQENLEKQINQKVDEQILTQIKLKETLVQDTSKINKLQQDFVNQTDEKINKLLLNQQGTNKLLEINKQKSTDLSSGLIKLVENKSNNFNYNLNKQLNITYDRVDALMSIHNLITLNAPLPIMHEWRISSDYAHSLINNVIGKKGSVIDIGSGVSSILMGYAMKQNGIGKVIALEHDKEYYKKTVKLITEHKLEKWCEVNYCPLKKTVLDGKDWLWYDIKNINFPKNIGLISADGPPGITQYMARYPALPLLKEYIKKDTIIMLDDGDRDEESKIASKWSQEFKLRSIKHNSHKGFFELRSV